MDTRILRQADLVRRLLSDHASLMQMSLEDINEEYHSHFPDGS